MPKLIKFLTLASFIPLFYVPSAKAAVLDGHQHQNIILYSSGKRVATTGYKVIYTTTNHHNYDECTNGTCSVVIDDPTFSIVNPNGETIASADTFLPCEADKLCQFVLTNCHSYNNVIRDISYDISTHQTKYSINKNTFSDLIVDLGSDLLDTPAKFFGFVILLFGAIWSSTFLIIKRLKKS